MKYCRFQQNGQIHYGLVESAAGRDVIMRILLTPPEEANGDVEGLRTRRIEPVALDEATLLPPVHPSKIVCVGRNYREWTEPSK
jgi:2-keto-4-pentenoate hydratase/2-oxohepta-3-ene-1,7-dioic acid hydratase in catechol pathway